MKIQPQIESERFEPYDEMLRAHDDHITSHSLTLALPLKVKSLGFRGRGGGDADDGAVF